MLAALGRVDFQCLDFKLSCYMFLLENLVPIFLKSENLFLVLQVLKKAIEAFLLQLHFARRDSTALLIQMTRVQVQQPLSSEVLLSLFRKLDATVNAEQRTQLIVLGEPHTWGPLQAGERPHSTGAAPTMPMLRFSKQLEAFNVFLTGQVGLSSASTRSLTQFLLYANSLLASSFFVSRPSRVLLLNHLVGLLSAFRSEVYADRITRECHLDPTYVELLFLTLLNFLRLDPTAFAGLPSFEMDRFLFEALEVFFDSNSLIFRRLFAKVLTKRLWGDLERLLTEVPGQGLRALPEQTKELLRCCLVVCKFNYVAENTEDLDLKDDLKTQIEGLLHSQGVLQVRQVLGRLPQASIAFSSDSDESFSDFDSSSSSRWADQRRQRRRRRRARQGET